MHGNIAASLKVFQVVIYKFHQYLTLFGFSPPSFISLQNNMK